MNRFSLTLALLAFGSLTNVFSQADYRPGYVVSLQGDTLRGSIDYRNWLRNPKTISFRPSAQGGEHTYNPLEIRAFGVAGDKYESAIVQVDVSPTAVGELSESPEPQLVADTAFIRALVTGEKNLYLYHSARQQGNNEQFYIRKNGLWELLIYKKYIRKQASEETRAFVATNNRYVKQLAFYLQECPSIQKKMRNIRYGSNSLEKLFRTYYECTTTTPAYEKKPEKHPVEFGILAGATQTSINVRIIDGIAPPPVARVPLSKGFAFTSGLFLDIVRMRNNRKWSLNNELVYTSFTSEGTYHVERNANDYTHTNINLEYSYLKLNTMVRFKYPVGKLHVFADVGISNAIVLSGSDKETEVRYYLNTTTVREGKAFDNGTESYDLGLLGGLGVRYQRYAFEARFERTQGMINYIAMSARLTRVAFLLSFRLTK